MEDIVKWLVIGVVVVAWSPLGKALARALQARSGTPTSWGEERLTRLEEHLIELEQRLQALEAPPDEALERKLHELEERVRRSQP